MSIKPKLLCRYRLSPGGVFLTRDFPILELLPAAWSSRNHAVKVVRFYRTIAISDDFRSLQDPETLQISKMLYVSPTRRFEMIGS